MTLEPTPTSTAIPALAGYALQLGDDALVMAQRLAEWITWAPQIEEDVALANLALDQLGQARVLLGYAGRVEGAGRDEDDLAYLRDERQFRNVHLVELPNGDFAHTVGRVLLFAAYQVELYSRLAGRSDRTLAGLAAKAVKEVRYHLSYARDWVVRLGDGTDESHRRMQQAIDALWPYVAELFDPDPVGEQLPAVAVDPVTLFGAWSEQVLPVLREATLEVPQPEWRSRGGRHGFHSEHLGPLLAHFQHLHRSHPGATW